jgi:hypothetical protein
MFSIFFTTLLIENFFKRTVLFLCWIHMAG